MKMIHQRCFSESILTGFAGLHTINSIISRSAAGLVVSHGDDHVKFILG